MSTTRRNFIGSALASAGALVVRAPSSLARKRRKKRSNALYEDHFDRVDRAGWGRAWFNQRYQRHWAIKGKKAVYHLPESAQKVYYRPCPILVLDHDVAPIDLRATISVSNVTARTGLAARALDYARYYT
ncbi:MAG: hypothetical protein ACRDJI_06440, partial [Actinomycetota bacterium]